MNPVPVLHDTFTIERDYPVPPVRVFAAFADAETKRRWFHGPDDWEQVGEHTLDFTVGGREHEAGGPTDGPIHTMDAIYLDIVENERIIYTYSMTLDGAPMSVSMATIELSSTPDGTRFVLTEHGAYFPSPHYELALAPADRLEGTGELLDQLGQVLAEHATIPSN